VQRWHERRQACSILHTACQTLALIISPRAQPHLVESTLHCLALLAFLLQAICLLLGKAAVQLLAPAALYLGMGLLLLNSGESTHTSQYCLPCAPHARLVPLPGPSSLPAVLPPLQPSIPAQPAARRQRRRCCCSAALDSWQRGRERAGLSTVLPCCGCSVPA
jgi:hypothetical protein